MDLVFEVQRLLDTDGSEDIDPSNDLARWGREYSIQQRNRRIATNTLYYGGGIATAVGSGLWETAKAIVDPGGGRK
jgi:hypothetical protein